jgi:hypothetical protein
LKTDAVVTASCSDIAVASSGAQHAAGLESISGMDRRGPAAPSSRDVSTFIDA